MPSVVGAEVVDLDRVRVLELRDRADLALEARLDLRVARQVRVQRLDGDLALRRPELLLALVDARPCRPRRGGGRPCTCRRGSGRSSGRAPWARRPAASTVPQFGQKRCDSSTDGLARGALHRFGAESSHSSGRGGTPSGVRRPSAPKVSGRSRAVRHGASRASRLARAGALPQARGTGGHGSDQRRFVARSQSSRRVPRAVAGKTTPMRVRSFCVNDGGGVRPASQARARRAAGSRSGRAR